MAVKILIMIYWIMALCSLVHNYKIFAVLQLRKLNQSYSQSKGVLPPRLGWAVSWTPKAAFCRLTPVVHSRASGQKPGANVTFARVLYVVE